MNDMDLETQLRSIASRMEYPSTPDIAGSVAVRLQSASRPRLVPRTITRSVVLVVVFLLSLMVLLPPVRAAVLDFIQVGVVRIFRSEPTPQTLPSTLVPLTATPASTQSSLILLLEQFAGETTLDNAQQLAQYPILLPTYPADLGKPDRVFVQDTGGTMTVLVWLDAQKPDGVGMSLQFIPENSWAIKKFSPTVIEEATVNGQYAIWTAGPYPILLRNGDMQVTRLVKGHVLIWENEDITYRLETDASMEEAIKMAESLKPIPP